MIRRSKIEFSPPPDLWNIVESWAAKKDYKLKSEAGEKRLYQKGVGFLVAPMMLAIDNSGQQTRMEAYVRAGLFVRAMSLFILPAEMGIQSGGFRGVAPRSIARKAVNKLLEKLGADPIQ